VTVTVTIVTECGPNPSRRPFFIRSRLSIWNVSSHGQTTHSIHLGNPKFWESLSLLIPPSCIYSEKLLRISPRRLSSSFLLLCVSNSPCDSVDQSFEKSVIADADNPNIGFLSLFGVAHHCCTLSCSLMMNPYGLLIELLCRF
jgi:hypothetical protein